MGSSFKNLHSTMSGKWKSYFFSMCLSVLLSVLTEFLKALLYNKNKLWTTALIRCKYWNLCFIRDTDLGRFGRQNMSDVLFWVFQNLLISWEFPYNKSLDFIQNGAKNNQLKKQNRVLSDNSVGENVLWMRDVKLKWPVCFKAAGRI